MRGEFENYAAESAVEATAFYATDIDTLYIDLDHDGAITEGADLVVQLSGLAAFNDANILV